MCIAKNFILNFDFLIVLISLHPQIPDFQIAISFIAQILSYSNKPYINRKLIHSALQKHAKLPKKNYAWVHRGQKLL